jgi:hypothetical protein
MSCLREDGLPVGMLVMADMVKGLRGACFFSSASQPSSTLKQGEHE